MSLCKLQAAKNLIASECSHLDELEGLRFSFLIIVQHCKAILTESEEGKSDFRMETIEKSQLDVHRAKFSSSLCIESALLASPQVSAYS